MFPSKPTAFSYSHPYLCLFSEYQIIIFNIITAEWIQTINVRRSRPLNNDGSLILCYVLDMPHLILLHTQGFV